MTMTMNRRICMLVAALATCTTTIHAFVPVARTFTKRAFLLSSSNKDNNGDDVLDAAIAAMFGADESNQEPPEATKVRIQQLVDQNKVLLFMKGTKEFPQCGFSDTATKILDILKVEYHTVDVLADEAVRQGIKLYSQWPTIPQLYVKGEFIGGSDIMMEMYESGELKELLKE